ncbi:MAG: hypothetical protein NXI24_15465 [bacterium]|nr:hypothetical protein [bacterium]
MLHDIYEDLDPEYTARIFQARKKLVGSVDQTLLPENGLLARGLLNDEQLKTVRNIRTRRLSPEIRERFIAD